MSDWITFTRDFGLAWGIALLLAMALIWRVRRDLLAAMSKVEEAANKIADLHLKFSQREVRCEQCEAKYDQMIERCSGRCDVHNCPALEELRTEVRASLAMFRGVADEFSRTITALLGIIRAYAPRGGEHDTGNQDGSCSNKARDSTGRRGNG